MDATAEFEKYTGGVYSQAGKTRLNHEISVVGWGVSANGEEFWYEMSIVTVVGCTCWWGITMSMFDEKVWTKLLGNLLGRRGIL